MIEINDKYIKEAESLLIDGKSFDEKERIPFIKFFDSCDLLAVPGSGKTTALLAKLYCLSKHLPFADGSGVLVLSHTNAAVNEIEKKLKKVIPGLFEYPNFVGTIQSFVNLFLANPACFQKYGEYLTTVDDDIANKLIENKTNCLKFESALSRYFFFQTFKQAAIIAKKDLVEEYNLTATKAVEVLKKLKELNVLNKGSLVYAKVKNDSEINTLELDDETKSIVKRIATIAKQRTNKEKGKRGTLYTLDFIENKFTYIQSLGFESDAGKSLLELYEHMFKCGIARYRDCYSLGYWYLHTYPSVKTLLQKRFKFVFIDEMQDLEKFQIDIIDKSLLGDSSLTRIQRIGDINQAIYNSGKNVESQTSWQIRKPAMYLNCSHRLTKEVADIVNYFTLDRQKDKEGNARFDVIGKRKLEKSIPPHLVLFDNTTKTQLRKQFYELIKKYRLQDTEEGQKYGFNIIGWNGKWDDDENHNGKLRLENVFECYKSEHNSLKETYDSLSKYLQCFDKSKNSLEPARKAILNALIHTLRIEGHTYLSKVRGKVHNRYYTKKELVKHIQEGHNGSNYELFKSKLYQWSFDLTVKQKYQEVYICIKNFINSDFKTWLGFEISQKCKVFFEDDFKEITQTAAKKNNEPEEIPIKIGTVHSVKGQTHCATMYVETSYYEYETEKESVKQALKKEEHNFKINDNKNQRGKQAFKMMYVGFSRPTHLLCFAVLKNNIQGEIVNYENAGWKKVDLTEN